MMNQKIANRIDGERNRMLGRLALDGLRNETHEKRLDAALASLREAYNLGHQHAIEELRAENRIA